MSLEIVETPAEFQNLWEPARSTWYTAVYCPIWAASPRPMQCTLPGTDQQVDVPPSSESLRFVLTLKINISFITSEPGLLCLFK